MNTKLTIKKLKLMKETLRDLTVKDAGVVKGGPCSLRTFAIITQMGCAKTKKLCPTKHQAGC